MATLVYFAALAPLAFLFAAFAKRPALAAGAFIGVMAVSTPATRALVVEAGLRAVRPARPAAAPHGGQGLDPRDVDSGDLVPQQAGYDPWVSLVAIAVVALASGFLVVRRYRRPA